MAEIALDKATEFIIQLQKVKPFVAGTQLLAELKVLNQQNLMPSMRMQLLEIYRMPIIQASDELINIESLAILPLSAETERNINLAENLWDEFAQNYRFAFIDLRKKLIRFGDEMLTILTIQRALDALGKQAMICYFKYQHCPQSLWSHLHQLYFAAIELNVTGAKVRDLAERESPTIDQTYKKILVTELSVSLNMIPDMIVRLISFLEWHTEYILIGDVNSADSPDGMFLVKLASDEPPISYNRITTLPNLKTDVALDVRPLVQLIQQYLIALGRNAIPKINGIREGANLIQLKNLFESLLKYCNLPPKRLYHRIPKVESVFLAVGLAEIHKTLTAEMQSKMSHKHDFSQAKWQMLNISMGGMLLRSVIPNRPPTALDKVGVGELLSIKSEQGDWVIGVCRWAANKASLDLGIELIASSAEPVKIKSIRTPKIELGLLLPPLTHVKQEATLLTTSGFYTVTTLMELEMLDKKMPIITDNLLERIDGFDRFQFNIL